MSAQQELYAMYAGWLGMTVQNLKARLRNEINIATLDDENMTRGMHILINLKIVICVRRSVDAGTHVAREYQGLLDIQVRSPQDTESGIEIVEAWHKTYIDTYRNWRKAHA